MIFLSKALEYTEEEGSSSSEPQFSSKLTKAEIKHKLRKLILELFGQYSK